jgi:hypothetical protein
MKYRFPIALLALMCCLVQKVSAHESPRSRFGLSVAPISASLRVVSDPWSGNGDRISWSFGVLGDMGLGPSGHWARGTGVRYTDIGGSLKVDANVDRGTGPTTVTGEVDLRMRYLEFPVTLTWRTTTAGPWDVYALGGASGAFHLRMRTDGFRSITEENGIASTTTYDNTSLNVDVVLFKASAVLGAGVEYELASGAALFTGLRYSAALNNALSKNASLYVTDSDKSKLYPDHVEITVGVYL